MSAVQELLNQVPMDQLANELGTDQQTAEQTAQEAIATLMGGLQNNVADPQGEVSLAQALQQHSGGSIAQRLVTGDQISLDQVDVEDGEKIVGHVLGNNEASYAAAAGSDNAMLQKALKYLAPLVLAYLAQKITSGQAGQGGGFGDILGQILGGGAGAQQTQEPQQQQGQGGGILGQILGQVLGGGR